MKLPSPKYMTGIVMAGLLMQAVQAQDLPVTPTGILIKEVASHAELMPNLEALCDGFGPRLTGSRQLAGAQAWAMATLKRYGAVNVHLEAYALSRPWQRGIARARLLNASGIALDVVQQGWTDGTDGVIEADVAVLDARTLDAFRVAAPALKGKIVLMLSLPAATPKQQKDIKLYRADVAQAIRQAGFAAVLLVSGRDGNLFDMMGGPGFPFDRAAAVMTKDHASLLQRLLAKGITPRMALQLTGRLGKGPVTVHNVVADLPGADPAAGTVIVGAHLDSWDLASGATDNGAGVVVMMEVLRAMHQAGLQPKRRLRVVLFSGEEQGLLGSKAYLAAHRDELQDIQAVLVQDAGAGRITGFPDMKVEAWYSALSTAVAPAAALGGGDVVYGASRGSDHATFFDAGIPAFSAMQDLRDYRSQTQHSQADTPGHAGKDDLVQAAQVMAVTAWGLLNGERLPHRGLGGH